MSVTKSWFSIKAKGEQSAVIDIFDDIGIGGIRAKDFIAALGALGPVTNITLRLNSYGGDVFDGVAIYNALVRHPATITVEIYGIAASIASVVAMAGDTVIMPANSYMFIHDPLGGVFGDADDMRETAEDLDKIGLGLVSAYVKKTGTDQATVKKWMTNDTWFTAAEALAAKLCDEVVEELAYAARADLRKLKNIPPALARIIPAVEANPDPPAPRSVPDPALAEQIRALAKCYDMENVGEWLVANCDSLDKARAKLDYAEAMQIETSDKKSNAKAVKLAKDRMLGILNACVAAGRPDLAPKLIEGDLSVEDVKVKLADPLEFAQLQIQYDAGAIREIYGLCISNGVEDLAAGFIAKGMSLDAVRDRLKHAGEIQTRCFAAGRLGLGEENARKRAHRFIVADATPEETSANLTNLLAAMDIEIDNHLPMSAVMGTPPTPAKEINTAEIYKMRNVANHGATLDKSASR